MRADGKLAAKIGSYYRRLLEQLLLHTRTTSSKDERGAAAPEGGIMLTWKRTATAVAVIIAATIAFPEAGHTGSAHFLKATGGIVAGTGDYTASFKEAGLGNLPITYKLDAVTTYTFQCFTKSNNNPHGSPNSGGPSDSSTQTTITPHNGQITGSLTLDVVFPPPTASCQGGGLKLCLTAANYTDVSLTDTTNAVTAGLPDAGEAAPAGSFISCGD
jgi:hypothetical protein